jgi:hypothetical protein
MDTERNLIEKYKNKRSGFAPWRFINTLSEDEFRADRRVMPNSVCGVIGGWIGQALRARTYTLQIPAGW